MTYALAPYPQWLEQIGTKQREFIVAERARFTEARKLYGAYVAAMQKLGLHALNHFEINDRFRELDAMEKNVDQAYGDNEANRAIYQTLSETVEIGGVEFANRSDLVGFHTGGTLSAEAPFIIGEKPSETCVDRATGKVVPR